MNNIGRHPNCSMRTEIGNCDPIGGFCTSINENICEVIQKLCRPTGEWIDSRDTDTPWNDGFKCSACNRNSLIRYNFCPNCGARMLREDGEA